MSLQSIVVAACAFLWPAVSSTTLLALHLVDSRLALTICKREAGAALGVWDSGTRLRGPKLLRLLGGWHVGLARGRCGIGLACLRMGMVRRGLVQRGLWLGVAACTCRRVAGACLLGCGLLLLAIAHPQDHAFEDNGLQRPTIVSTLARVMESSLQRAQRKDPAGTEFHRTHSKNNREALLIAIVFVPVQRHKSWSCLALRKVNQVWAAVTSTTKPGSRRWPPPAEPCER